MAHLQAIAYDDLRDKWPCLACHSDVSVHVAARGRSMNDDWLIQTLGRLMGLPFLMADLHMSWIQFGEILLVVVAPT